MPYNKTIWENGITDVDEINMNNIEGGVEAAFNRSESNNKGIAFNSAAIAELAIAAEIETKLAPTSGKFYAFVGSGDRYGQGLIDFGKTYAGVVTTGINTIAMTSLLSAKDGTTPTLLSDCFEVGDEVTIQDDSIREVINVTNVNDGNATLTLSGNIAGTFASGANVYRSNVKADGDVYKFGGFTAETVIDKTTPVQVVNAAYSTEGNGGRKQVKLDNGWLVNVLKESSQIRFMVSKDEGATWSQLCRAYNGSPTNNAWIASNGSIIYCIVGIPSGVSVEYLTFDAVTQTDVDIWSTRTNIDSSQTALGECSLAIAPNGDLHATWSSKNATYPNSFNIRYSKSTDGGVTWDSPTQVTTLNTSGIDMKNPTIVIMGNGYPLIIHEFISGSTVNNISKRPFNGTDWTSLAGTIYSGGTYTQSNPSADVKSNGTIIVTWHGKDSTDTAKDNIRFSQSTDNAANWSAMEKLTSGNSNNQQFPSLTRDKDDIIHIVHQGVVAGVTAIRYIKGISGAFVQQSDITTTLSYNNPSTVNNFRNFENPLTIFEDVNDDVQFYGKWTKGTETEVTEVDIRLNITPLNPVSDIGAYMNITDNVLAVDAKVSIVDSADAESYTDLIDTRYEIDASNDEVASLLNTTVTAEEKVTLLYNLTRTLTTDIVELTSILGGVA